MYSNIVILATLFAAAMAAPAPQLGGVGDLVGGLTGGLTGGKSAGSSTDSASGASSSGSASVCLQKEEEGHAHPLPLLGSSPLPHPLASA